MSSMNSMRLRDLIRSVRQCKTASEERSLINRECADIRQGFKENTPYLRTRNMLKLLYIHMLGYPTEFGQLEVVNLISQPDFAGKRIGYLALQLLLSESDEVLTLSENRMKSDMSSGNPLVQAVALHAAANVASEDMARDIFDEVIKLISSHNPYIRKKACLTALRVVIKVPEHAEYFLECFTDIFSETHSSTLMCGLALINACLQTPEGEPSLTRYRKLAAAAVRVLKALVLSSRVTDSDVGGITDPFLQVKLLQFMRFIGRGSAVTSEALNDVLAQVITNTDATRNVGCAVHYECVRTIDSIESDEGLRALAVNTVGRFLSSSRDNNLRFVALQTLLHYAKWDVETVQQHQAVILECLKDVDISIRRRALDLTVALITESNVRLLVPDLLTYLSLCAEEIREDVTVHICRIIEEKSPSDEWRVELSLKLLKLARNHAPLDFATRLIAVISCQPRETQTRAAMSLWTEASYPFDALHQARKAFLVVALWIIGEYAEYITDGGEVTAAELAASVSEIATNSSFTLIKQYGLTALMKLATKYADVRGSALATFSGLVTSLDCELQQRAREYSVLLKSFPAEAAFSFSRMPPMRSQTPGEGEAVHPVPVVSPEMLEKQTANALDDLFNVGGGDSAGAAPPTAAASESAPQGTLGNLFGGGDAPQPAPSPQKSALDDLFGGGGGGDAARGPNGPQHPTAPAPPPPQAPRAPHHDPMSDLFGGGGSGGGTDAPHPTEEQVFDCTDLTVHLVGTRYGAGQADTELVIRSKASAPLQDMACLLATLKTCTLTSSPLASRVLESRGQTSIKVHVDSSGDAKAQDQLKLRVVLSYVVNGEKREQQISVSSQAK